MSIRSSRGETEESHAESGTSRDDVFEALSNHRRRKVIRYLNEVESEARVRDVAERIAAWENGIEVPEVTYKQRKRVYTSLHQSHLPKLARGGFIEYEPNRGVLSLCEGSRELEVYLEVVSGNDLLWGEYYVGLGFLCLLLTVAAWIGTVPFASVSGYAYAFAFSAAFVGSGLVHLVSTRRNRLG